MQLPNKETNGKLIPPKYQWFANADLDKQASAIATGLKTDNKIDVKSDKEIIALIAYLQRIGKDIKLEPKTAIQ